MGLDEIKLVEQMKLLGLTIDNKLTFNQHVRVVCRKATNIQKRMATIAKIEQGLKSQIIRIIYVAVIEPVILYAAYVLDPATKKVSVQKQLNTTQKIAKSYRTASLNATLVLTEVLPLDLRIWETADIYRRTLVSNEGMVTRFQPCFQVSEPCTRCGRGEWDYPIQIGNIQYNSLVFPWLPLPGPHDRA